MRDIKYNVGKNDDVIEIFKNNIEKWQKNYTLVVIDDGVLIKLLNDVYDYDINKDDVCELYLDPLHHDIISIKKEEGFRKYVVTSIMIEDQSYMPVPFQAFASTANFVFTKEKNIRK